MARALLLVALLTAVTAWTEQPYKGYRLLLTQPRDAAQVAALAALMPLPGVDLWERPRVDREVRLAVAPQAWHGVRHAMAASGLAFAERDLKSLLDREVDEQRTARLRPWENPGQARFDAYMRHNEIETYLKMLAIRHASASLIHIGTSFEGRNMTVIRIGASAKKASKAVFIDAGIHAREWIAPALAVYIIHQLVENATANADLLEDLDWYILPVANPDGYEYSHDTYRLWRKNRGGTKQTRCERGVDLNRNFGYHYGETGISTNPCSDIYAGSGAFSEKETRNMRDFLLDLNADKSVKMYLALHSYGEMILYPWGYSLSAPLPKDYSELVAIAEDANRAMVKAGSTSFDVMSGADLYPAAGASDDWAKGSAGIEKSYTVELQGGGSYGFDLPASRIARSVQLVFEAIKVFGKHAKSL